MGERQWIREYILPRVPASTAEVSGLLGPGDDAALCPIPAGEVSVLTIDGLIEGQHWLAGWLSEDELAERLIAVTVSDLSAMGATPLGILLSFETPHLPGSLGSQFFQGIDRGLSRCGALLGGNVVSTSGPLSLTATAIGSVDPERALRRSQAQAEDTIAVSGLPGRAAAARKRIARGDSLSNAERSPWVCPPDRNLLGKALVEQGVRAAIDISDGLLCDLKQLLAASEVGAELELAPLARAAEGAGFSLNTALGGGEDYELCIAGDEHAIARAFAAVELPPPLSIGTIHRETTVEIMLDGVEIEPEAPGWDPFSESTQR